MKIAVLGAGVIGLTTTWALVQRGHEVLIVDRRPTAGLETSFGNGGQLSYAYVAPLASASTLAKLPSLLFSRDGPLRVKPSLALDFIRWGLAFIRACNDETERESMLALLELARLSRAETSLLTVQLALSYGLAEPGKLVIFRSAKSLAAASKNVELFARFGIEQEITSPSRSLEIEPSLRIPASEIVGGVFTPSEQVGDCAEFCAALAARLRASQAVSWLLDAPVQRARIEKRRIRAVETGRGDIEADAYVLAMASGSTRFARSAGLYLPVQPLKGYSLTASTAPGGRVLNRSVTDFDNKTVFAPILSGRVPKIRIAGVADMVGHDTAIDRTRLRNMRDLAHRMLNLDGACDDRPWAGLRPLTPDGRPIIGQSPIENLFLNTGHGGLGWTLACGSARACADLVNGDPPAVALEPFALMRRTSHGLPT